MNIYLSCSISNGEKMIEERDINYLIVLLMNTWWWCIKIISVLIILILFFIIKFFFLWGSEGIMRWASNQNIEWWLLNCIMKREPPCLAFCFSYTHQENEYKYVRIQYQDLCTKREMTGLTVNPSKICMPIRTDSKQRRNVWT